MDYMEGNSWDKTVTAIINHIDQPEVFEEGYYTVIDKLV